MALILAPLAKSGPAQGPPNARVIIPQQDSVSAPPAIREDPLWVAYETESDLLGLLQFVSSELGYAIDYEPNQVKGKVSLRAPGGLTLQGFWLLLNRRLAGQQLALVHLSGEDVLSLVALDQAAGLARLEEGELSEARAGFVKALVPIRSKDPSSVQQAISQLLPKGGSVTAALSNKGHLLIAGLKPQVLEAVRALSILDAGPAETVIHKVRLTHSSPQALAARLEQLRQTQESVAPGSSPPGSFFADDAGEALVVIAPPHALDRWIDLIEQLDAPDAISTRHYTPRRFTLEETAGLLEQYMGRSGAKPPGWSVIQDALTGALIVTASTSDHLEVEGVMERLESSVLPPRQELRSFPIANRDVEELVKLLEALLEGRTGLPETARGSQEAQPIQGATTPLPVMREGSDSPGAAKLTLSADKDTNRLLAYGDIRLLGQLERLLLTLDVPHPQVLLEVLVVNLSESDLFDLGIELHAAGVTGDTLLQFASIFGLGSPDVSEETLQLPAGAGGTGVVLDPGDYSAVIRALASVNEGRTLTVPKILVSNHETGNLAAVIQAPYATTTSATSAVATTSFGGTTDAGTTITVTPHVLSGDRLRLNIELSISTFVGESIDPSLPPPRQETSLNSTVFLPDGHTVVLGGLEISAESESITSIPVLGDIPLLGRLFQNRSKSLTRSRFFVFLRPTILRAMQFEDLRYLSTTDKQQAGLLGDFPVLAPRIMR